jgi:hypothetical protein
VYYYICIDDTDNLESIGTGTIADQIRDMLLDHGFQTPSLVTRHQLFIHPDIPYTSHNNSMCFTIEGLETDCHEIIALCSDHLKKTAADGSDPGLCILPYYESQDYSKLIHFGKAAKISILNKDAAYLCAKQHQAHLSEHGGTGDGIIGALAGVGLRLSGSDGEIKASLKNFPIGNSSTVTALKKLAEIDLVLDYNSKKPLADSDTVHINQRTKTVLYKNSFVLFVQVNDAFEYTVLGKSQIRKLGDSFYE